MNVILRKSKKKNYISAIFCLLCFVVCIVSGTFAMTVNAAGGTASLTLNCVKDGEIISGMEWNIYHVADDLSAEKPKLTKSFNKYRREISLGDGSLSAMSQLASTLKGYTIKGKIKPTQTAVSDSTGKVKFTNLEQGYYLLCAQKFKIDHVAWESEPLLAILVGDEDYEIDAFPKMKYITLNASEVQFTVKKVWANDEDMPHLRSVYITAEIYKDGEFDHLIRLDESNDWTYSWTGDPGADWFVIEQEIPQDYTVIYRKQDVEYVIVNTYTPGGSSSWEEWDGGDETTTHETDDYVQWSETTTTQPSGQITTELETTTSDKMIYTNMTSTTSETVKTGESDVTTSSTSETTTTTTTTTQKPGSGSGSGSSNSGGSSSSSRYSSGGGSSSYSSNSGSGSSSGSGNASKIEKLPQTGQLWWPVVPLAAGGVLLMGIGLKIKEKEQDA